MRRPSSSRARTAILRPVAHFSLTANSRRAGVAGGGVVFTTIQKFMPAEQGDRNAVLSDRRNIVVIADEAHRGQYDYISIYDIQRAVEDGATVPIY